ncbi:RidA family protein [Geothermobacter hydrogeniphilus]|uniref:Reactive intermediate/imine deaminase n=1 Tax=Geothermobacter hydrogeniphilus TaxID=1969733 RepID=A0A1X0Y1F1_9BACT|nr:RidA family protein [Geothermobacter hydrogeniphilus]ORJ59025.1 reactive intermediate/imine deaminase [Geothermobacter hydrogeniphilus]
MAKEIIQSDNAPAAIGPYAQGVRVGDQVWFSGQIPLDPVSGEVVSGGIAEQTEQVMKNMGAVLAAAGLNFGQVVKTTIYLVDLADFAVVNEIYGRFFPVAPPARATVEVAALPKGVSVEIEWIAHDDA